MMEERVHDTLKELLRLNSEKEWVEFKENNCRLEDIGERISAISNSANLESKKCGYLVFGVKDQTHEIVGTEFKPKSSKRGNEEIENWLIQRLNPRIPFCIHEFQYEEQNLVMFEIPAAIDRPVSFLNEEYVRVGSYTRKLRDFPEKERKIWENLQNKRFEREVATSNIHSDDVLQLLDYPAYFSSLGLPLPSDKNSILDKLAEEKLISKHQGKYDITNLGAILFAKDIKDFEALKRKAVRVIIYKGKDRIEAIREQEGGRGYAIGFQGLVEYINDQLPANEKIEKALRVEKKMYPEVAVRELVANALIHQDFSEKGNGPMIEIFEDRVEITNPGKPLISIERFIDHAPQSRNEDLAAFMRRIKVCEERGSGIDKVISQIEYLQLPPPSFEEGENFTRVTIYSYRPLNKMTKDEKIRACYQHCVLRYVANEQMTNESLRKRFNIADSNYPIASRIINDTLGAGVIKPFDPDSMSKKHAKYIPIWA